MKKYVEGGAIGIPVTDTVKVEVPFGTLAATLLLAELYQRNGRTEEAIGLVQQLLSELGQGPFLVLGLADLYAETGAWDEVVDLTAGVSNEDDVSLQVRLIQARAFREQGMDDAALEAYKDALRSKKRDPELLKAAGMGGRSTTSPRERKPRHARSWRRSMPRMPGIATWRSCSGLERKSRQLRSLEPLWTLESYHLAEAHLRAVEPEEPAQ